MTKQEKPKRIWVTVDDNGDPAEEYVKLSEMKAEYKRGFIAGLIAYAHSKNGEQHVGTTGTTLKEAIADVEKTWNYEG